MRGGPLENARASFFADSSKKIGVAMKPTRNPQGQRVGFNAADRKAVFR
jgi:hypothetical protein